MALTDYAAIAPPTDTSLDQLRALVTRINEENLSHSVHPSEGWAISNNTELKTLDVPAATLDDVANVLATLIAYLMSRGELRA
jgi:hypothetical protein